MRQITLALLIFLGAISIARADGELDKRITPFDKDRLARFDATLQEAMAQATAGGSREDLATLNAALAGSPLTLAEGFDPTGNWACRTIKAGGETPRAYGEDTKENQVALVERRAKNRMILMFPAPQYESKLDVLVLER
jgi:hypothetical protein